MQEMPLEEGRDCPKGFFERIKKEVFCGRDRRGWAVDDPMYFIDRHMTGSGMKESWQCGATEVQMII